jgi:hypothetical protein
MTVFTPPPVMILGCGRSGTSIFGELFEHLPDYQYRSEPAFADVVDADYTSPLAFKVPRESEGFSPDPGQSFPLAALMRNRPDMRLFWIVRHPLDAICSLRVGIAKNWRPPLDPYQFIRICRSLEAGHACAIRGHDIESGRVRAPYP